MLNYTFIANRTRNDIVTLERLGTLEGYNTGCIDKIASEIELHKVHRK